MLAAGLVVAVAVTASALLVEDASGVEAATIPNPCDDLLIAGSDGRVPNRYQTVVQVNVTPAICELEQRIIAQIADDRGVALTRESYDQIIYYGRNEVRTRLLAELLQLVEMDRGDRDEVEQGAVEWLSDRYRDFRVDAARAAIDEYDAWAADPCGYTPPDDYDYNAGDAACNGLSALFAPPRPPKYEEFVFYGLTQLTESAFDGDFAQDFLANALSGLATLATSAAVGAYAGVGVALGEVLAVIMPSLVRGTTVTVLGTGSLIGVGVAAIVMIAVTTSIVHLKQSLKDRQIPNQLDFDLIIAGTFNEGSVVDALESEFGVNELLGTFLDATGPDYSDPPVSVFPTAPQPDSPWFVTDPLSGASNAASTVAPTFVVLGLDKVRYEVWVEDGWFVQRPLGGTGDPFYQPTLSYFGPDGEPYSARFVDGELFVVELRGDATIDCDGGVRCKKADTLEYATEFGPGVSGDLITGSAMSRLIGLPPQINAGPMVTGDLVDREIVTFSVDATDPEGEELQYEWSVTRDSEGFADVTTTFIGGSTVQYQFLGVGPHEITVTVTDPTGASASASSMVVVVVGVALSSTRTLHRWNGIDYREQPLLENTPGLFEVTAGLGSRVRVDWDRDGLFDATQNVDAGGIATFPTPAFPEGIHPVDVSVDSGPDTPSVIGVFPIDVINAPPVNLQLRVYHADDGWQIRPAVVDLDAPNQGRPTFYEGDTVNFRMSVGDVGNDPIEFRAIRRNGATRPGGGAAYEILQLTSDGSGEVEGAFILDDQVEYVTNPTFGDLPMILVTASDGVSPASLLSTGSNLAFFQVENLPPVIEEVIDSVDRAGLVDLDVRVSDPGIASRDVTKIEIDWGDGSDAEEALLNRRIGGIQLFGDIAGKGQHRYAAPGTYPVTITAYDDETSVSITYDVVVPPFAPVIDEVTGLVAAEEGAESQVTVIVTDVDTPLSEVTVTFDWGDGTSSVGMLAAGEFVGTHVYAESGVYPVDVDATDGSLDAITLEGSLDIADTAPSVTVEQAASQADPTTGDVTFDVVFSEPVTGFDATDVVLGGTAGATSAVATDSGDAAAYAVTVSGMTVNGSVVLTVPANAAANVNGTPSAASTSTDNSVEYVLPRRVIVPSNIAVDNEPGRDGATVTFSVSSTGGIGDAVLSCLPQSGDFFPIGVTTVTCTATELPSQTSQSQTSQPARLTLAETSASGSFEVEVRDLELPTIEPVVAPSTVTSPDGSPVAVGYDVPGVSDNSGGGSVTCAPPSGSLFPVGSTTVTCTAADASGNTASTTFTVVVDGPAASTTTTTVSGSTTTVVPTGQLPQTGSDTPGTLRIAVMAMLLGMALVLGTLRRRQHSG